MKAMTQLPQEYNQLGNIRLSKNTPLLIILNLLALPLGAGSLWLFGSAVQYLVPGFALPGQYILDLPTLLAIGGALLGIIAVVILLHEAVHGAFFWLFSRKRPIFGISWTYAYAAAPGWYFPRGQYLVIGLAPLVLLSLIGVLLLPLLPP